MVSREGLNPNLKQRITEPSITRKTTPHASPCHASVKKRGRNVLENLQGIFVIVKDFWLLHDSSWIHRDVHSLHFSSSKNTSDEGFMQEIDEMSVCILPFSAYQLTQDTELLSYWLLKYPEWGVQLPGCES